VTGHRYHCRHQRHLTSTSPPPHLHHLLHLQIYRKLADGTLAPVHQTVHVKRQRDCVWKTAPIAVQRLCNGDLRRTIVLEVWDWEENSANRLIGSVELTASKLLASALDGGGGGADAAAAARLSKASVENSSQGIAEALPLVPPRASDKRANAPMSRVLGGGISRAPGVLAVHRAFLDADEGAARRQCETFDVDAIAHEKRAVGAPEWESLRRRMERHVDRTASGTALRETTRGMRMRKRVHHAQSYIGSLSVTRVLLKYQPFHQAYLAVGSHFGSGIQVCARATATAHHLHYPPPPPPSRPSSASPSGYWGSTSCSRCAGVPS